MIDTITTNDKLAQSIRDQTLASRMGEILVNSDDLKSLNCLSFSFKREAFVNAMHKRFGADYDYEVIKRVALQEFDVGLQILRLRES